MRLSDTVLFGPAAGFLQAAMTQSQQHGDRLAEGQ
jgi:hypothetical protein